MEQYQKLVNDWRWKLFFYFGLYNTISVRLVIGRHHCVQGFVPGCGQGGPRPVISFYRYLFCGSDIHVLLSKLPRKKKKKRKKGKLKRL